MYFLILKVHTKYTGCCIYHACMIFKRYSKHYGLSLNVNFAKVRLPLKSSGCIVSYDCDNHDPVKKWLLVGEQTATRSTVYRTFKGHLICYIWTIYYRAISIKNMSLKCFAQNTRNISHSHTALFQPCYKSPDSGSGPLRGNFSPTH